MTDIVDDDQLNHQNQKKIRERKYETRKTPIKHNRNHSKPEQKHIKYVSTNKFYVSLYSPTT